MIRGYGLIYVVCRYCAELELAELKTRFLFVGLLLQGPRRVDILSMGILLHDCFFFLLVKFIHNVCLR